MGIVEGSKAKSSLNFRTYKKPQTDLFRVYSVSDHTPRNCVGKQSNNPTYPIQYRRYSVSGRTVRYCVGYTFKRWQEHRHQ